MKHRLSAGRSSLAFICLSLSLVLLLALACGRGDGGGAVAQAPQKPASPAQPAPAAPAPEPQAAPAPVLPPRPTAPTTRKGGTLVVALPSDPSHLNPGISTGFDVHAVADSMFNGLVGLDANQEPVPDLAQSWDVSPDSKVYTFHLHPNVLWHDGKPFSSADVKFTFENILLKFHSRTKAGLEKVLVAVETPDTNTVIFRFKEPYGPLLQRLDVTEAPLLPKHIYEGTDPLTAAANLRPVGTGPFKFVSFTKGVEVQVARNENYFKKGLPYLDKVVFRVIPETATQVAALESGDVDYVWRVPGPDVERLSKRPGIKLVRTAAGPGGGQCIMTLAFNLERPVFQDLKMRQAFAHAINRQELLNLAQFGEGRVATAPISSGIPWAHHTGLEPYAFDPLKARSLATATKVNLLAFPTFLKWMELLRAQLKEANIDLELVPLDRAALVDRVFTKRNFDTTLISYCNNQDPEIGVTRMYVSTNIGPTPFSNAAAYRNAAVDFRFREAASTVRLEDRAKAYRRIQELLWEDLPYWWLVETDFTVGHRATFQGFQAWSGHFAETAGLASP